jgi:hypothetical protein
MRCFDQPCDIPARFWRLLRFAIVVLLFIAGREPRSQEPGTSIPAGEKARVIVFRPFALKVGSPLIFANGILMGKLSNSTYGIVAVNPGEVTLSASVPMNGQYALPGSDVSWGELPECEHLNWNRLIATEPFEVLETCKNQTIDLYRRCGVSQTRSGGGGFVTVITRIPRCNPLVQGTGSIIPLIEQTQELRRAMGGLQVTKNYLLRNSLKFQASAGKTYYVEFKWALAAVFTEMYLVEEETGAKEIKRLKQLRQDE